MIFESIDTVTASALVFTVLNSFFILLNIYDYTLLSLLLDTYFFVLIFALLYSQFQVIAKKKNNPIEELINFDNIITKEFFEEHFRVVHRVCDSCKNDLKEAFYGTNLVYTLKVAGLFYLVATVLSCFSFVSLLWIAVVLSFSVPIVNKQYEKEINMGITLVWTNIEPFYRLVLDKIPGNKKTE